MDRRWSRAQRRRPTLQRRLLLALGILLLVTGHPGAAFAHGGTDQSGFTNYESTIVSVLPAVPGLEVSTFGVTGGIKVVNKSNSEVIVLGYDNEPYLRLTTGGTFANRNSPATYVNLRADANVPVPEQPTSSDIPDWHQLSFGNTVWWHDHRAHWMGTAPPDIVQADPSSPHVVYEAWTVPMLVNGEQVTITGQLRWVPPPSRMNWLLITLGVFLGGVLILHVVRPIRPIAGLIIVAGLVGNIFVAASRATVELASSAERVSCFIAAAAVVLLVVIGLASRMRSGPPLLWGLAGAVLAGSGIAYLKVFSFAVMDGSAPTEHMRWAVLVELALGAALAIATIVGYVEHRMVKHANRVAAAERAAVEAALAADLAAVGEPTAGAPSAHDPFIN